MRSNRVLIVNAGLIEITLLFVLLLNVFKAFSYANQILIFFVGILFLIYVFLTIFTGFAPRLSLALKVSVFLLIIILLYGSMLKSSIASRITFGELVKLHDSARQTEYASSQFLLFRNPYEISYETIFKGDEYIAFGKPHPVVSHYVYSPLSFLIPIPVSELTKFLYGFIDIRLSLALFLLLTAIAGIYFVKEKTMFLTLFLLNPLFVGEIFWATNDVFVLFFLVLCVGMIYFKRFTLASIFLSLGFATKLTIVPFIPLYFLYLYIFTQKQKIRKSQFLKQIVVFMACSLLIYGPFLFWDAGALIEDLIIYPLGGGIESYPIHGIIGIPQLLVSKGIISPWSMFPFYLFSIISVVLFLFISLKVLILRLEVWMLCLLYVIFFIFIFSISKIFQPNYLYFLSQVLVFASFLSNEKTKRERKV